MKPYYEHAGITIYHGDCREILPQIHAESIITDPVWPNCPAGLLSALRVWWEKGGERNINQKENAMSWSVSGSGTPAEVRGQLSEQFKYPLAEKPAGLADDGERVTVQQVSELCEQILSTFDSKNQVAITANGHMGFSNWDKKEGCYQSVNISVTPKG